MIKIYNIVIFLKLFINFMKYTNKIKYNIKHRTIKYIKKKIKFY